MVLLLGPYLLMVLTAYLLYERDSSRSLMYISVLAFYRVRNSIFLTWASLAEKTSSELLMKLLFIFGKRFLKYNSIWVLNY